MFCVSLVTVSVPRLTIPKQPVRLWKKLLGKWSLGDDGGEMVLVPISSELSFSMLC